MTKQAHNPRRKSPNNAILSTLALAWAEHAPFLPFASIRAHLHAHENTCPSSPELKTRLRELLAEGTVRYAHSRYSLEPSESVYKESITHTQISARKLKRAQKALALFQAVPFLRSAAVTGSVAFGAAQEQSDVDLFCLTAKGRIWTARMGVLIVSELLGRRRERARPHTDKLCANYFAAENGKLPVKNIAAAYMLKRAIVLWGAPQFHRFLEKNRWIQAFFCQDPAHAERTPSAHLPREVRSLVFIQAACERLLSGKFGDLVEKACKAWQLSRLEAKAARGGDTSQLVLTDDIIALHHPRPKNKEVMERYEQKMSELGINL